MAQAIAKKPSNIERVKSAVRGGGRLAGEILALSSMGLGLISSLLLAASLMP